MNKNILLIEPNYKNKYPPIGLMKIATYHRRMGDNVVFYKGDLKDFLIGRITLNCVSKLQMVAPDIIWQDKQPLIFQYIKTRKKTFFDMINIQESQYEILVIQWLEYYKSYYHKKYYLSDPEWDRIYITTLFTFYWDITVETIEFAKTLIKDSSELLVGGVLATILANELEQATKIKPHRGLLNRPGELDLDNTDIIDDLPLDYSILEEIEYKYSDTSAYYGYTTRGCIRKCSFCAVPTLEPIYCGFIPLIEKIRATAALYGDQRNLLLMDNNILASKNISNIINEIKLAGFAKDSLFYEPNFFDISIRNLKDGVNDNAYKRKLFFIIEDLEKRIKNPESKQFIFGVRKEYQLLKLETATKEALIEAHKSLATLYEKHRSKISKKRYVDFNQGVDARLFTEENVKLLGEIPIRPLRIAFDDLRDLKYYNRAIRLSKDVGIKDFSNYLLYNFKDKPEDLYKRLKINVELCEELNVSIYSFPMKFHPLKGEFSHNRDFIGEFWNKKYIRAIQAILNSTKGKVGRGKSFFYEAFGKNMDEFHELLVMPETFILYRFFFKSIGYTDKWRKAFCELDSQTKEEALRIIHKAEFSNIEDKTDNPLIISLLKYYTNYRAEIITPGTELFKLKEKYDLNPTHP